MARRVATCRLICYFFSHLRIQIDLFFSGRFLQVSAAHDVIAVKHAPGLVARNLHGYSFRNPRSDHIPCRRAPEIVRNPRWNVYDFIIAL